MKTYKTQQMELRMTPDLWPPQDKFRIIRFGTFNQDILLWKEEGDFLDYQEALKKAFSYEWDRILWNTMSFYIIDSSGDMISGVIESKKGRIPILGIKGVPMPPLISV